LTDFEPTFIHKQISHWFVKLKVVNYETLINYNLISDSFTCEILSGAKRAQMNLENIKFNGEAYGSLLKTVYFCAFSNEKN